MRSNLIICRITGRIMLCIQLDKLRIEANWELSYHDISIWLNENGLLCRPQIIRSNSHPPANIKPHIGVWNESYHWIQWVISNITISSTNNTSFHQNSLYNMDFILFNNLRVQDSGGIIKSFKDTWTGLNLFKELSMYFRRCKIYY